MSKSSPTGCLFVLETLVNTERTIRGAVTDSELGITYDPIRRPGLANLLNIYSGLTALTPPDVAVKFAGQTNTELKSELSKIFDGHFYSSRIEYSKMEDGYIDSLLNEHASRMNEVAANTYNAFQDALGT